MALDDYLKLFIKPLTKGIAGNLSDDVLSHYSNYIKNNADNLDKALPKWAENARTELNLTDDVLDALDDFVKNPSYKLLADPKIVKTLADFGSDFASKINGATHVNDIDVNTLMGNMMDNLANQGIKMDARIQAEWFGPLNKECRDLLDIKSDTIELYTKQKTREITRNFESQGTEITTEVEARIAQEADKQAYIKWADEYKARSEATAESAQNLGEESSKTKISAEEVISAGGSVERIGNNVLKTKVPFKQSFIDSIENIGTAIKTTREALKRDFIAMQSDFKGTLKEVFDRAKATRTNNDARAAPRGSDGEILAADSKPWRENWFYRRTFGRAENLYVALDNPISSIRNLWGDQTHPFRGARTLDLGEKFIQSHVEYFDKHLFETGANKYFTAFESDLNKVAHALAKQGEINGELVTSKNVSRMIGDVFDQYSGMMTTNKEMQNSLQYFREHLVALKNRIEITETVDANTKYPTIHGLQGAAGDGDMPIGSNKAHIMDWLNDTIETVDNLFKPKGENKYIKEIQGKLDNRASAFKASETDARTVLSDMLFTAIDSRVGRRVGSHNYTRRYGLNLAQDEDGGFILKENGTFWLGGKTDWYGQYGLTESLARCSYNTNTRFDKPISENLANIGSGIGVASSYKSLSKDAFMTALEKWGTDLQKDFSSGMTALLGYGEKGEALANHALDYMMYAEGKNVLKTKPKDFLGEMHKAMKAAEADPFKHRQYENLYIRAKRTLDSPDAGNPRDIAQRYYAERELMRLVDKAERGTFFHRYRSGPDSNIVTSALGHTVGNAWIGVRDSAQWLMKMGGHSGPAATDYLRKTLWSGWRRAAWSFGADVKYTTGDFKTQWHHMSDDKYDELSFMGKRWANITHGITRMSTRPFGASLLNPATGFGYNMRAASSLIDCKPVATLVVAGAGYSGAEMGRSLLNYANTDSKDKTPLGDYFLRLGVDTAHNFTKPLQIGMQAIQIGAGGFHSGLLKTGNWVGHAIAPEQVEGSYKWNPFMYRDMVSNLSKEVTNGVGINQVIDQWTDNKELNKKALETGKSYDTLGDKAKSSITRAAGKLESLFNGHDKPAWKELIDAAPEKQNPKDQETKETELPWKKFLSADFDKATPDASDMNNQFTNRTTAAAISRDENMAQTESPNTNIITKDNFVSFTS
jgi:hypothetical protein